MAEKKVDLNAQVATGIAFSRVTTNYIVAGGHNRGPCGCTVERSGASRTNVEGTNLVWANLYKFPNITRDNLHFSFGADPINGNIAIYPAVEGPGLMKVRDWGDAIGFHLGGVFKEHPKLRPNTTVECTLRLDQDATGQPCFVFNVLRGLAKKRLGIEGGRPEPAKKVSRRRKKSDSGAESATQLAPGQQDPSKSEPEATK